MAHLKNLEHEGSKGLKSDIEVNDIITLPEDIKDIEKKTDEQLNDEQLLYLATNNECWVGEIDDDD